MPVHSILVYRNPYQITNLLHLAPRHPRRPQIPQHEMVIRSRGLEFVPVRYEFGCERAGVGDDLGCVGVEGGGGGLEEGGGDGGAGL